MSPQVSQRWSVKSVFFARSACELQTSTPHLQNRCATFAYTVMIIVLVSLLGLVRVLSRNL